MGTKFQSSVSQLTSKTGIEPVKLRLDDVGYNYQNVFVAALVRVRKCLYVCYLQLQFMYLYLIHSSAVDGYIHTIYIY